MTTTRYREIEVSGEPLELGRQIGEAAGEEVRGFCSMAMDRVRLTTRISNDKAMEVARKSTTFAEAYRPDLVEELRGVAQAAKVTLDDLMLIQVRNQLAPEESEGCTSLSAMVGDHGVVAQNWDNDPALDPFTVVITRRPAGKPAYISCGQAGLIAYMGFNEEGVGACVNTLPAPSRGIGAPHYFTLRELFEASSLDQAAEAIRRAERAIPVNIMLTTPQGPADIEATIDNVYVLRPESSDRIYHTNHCLHKDIAHYNDIFPELIESHFRTDRVQQIFNAPPGQAGVEHMKQVLSDHENHPTSICRHANDDPLFGFWETVFSIICEPSEGRMHISRGTPCNHPFEVYCL